MGPKIILGLTGSVASVQAPLILANLRERFDDEGIELKVVTTQNAKAFYTPEALGEAPLYSDRDEWEMWKGPGDTVPHVELRRWADMLVIAPLDANTLAKMANGLCDNLLTCVVRAWDMTKPVLLAPAMNTHMWIHPHTAQHIAIMEKLGYHIIPPVTKKLACGDVGIGAMASVSSIVDEVANVWREVSLGTDNLTGSK